VAALCIVAAAVAFVLLHRQGRQQPAGGAAGEIESVAVLPFVNKKGDPETEYLSDGLTESIINNLAQLPRLRVIARASVFHFKGRDQDAQAIGQQLKVQAVLTGSVSQHDNDLVVHAELVDVSDNRHLWADRYQRPLAEALLVQEEISRQIVDRLSARLTGDEQQRATKRYTENGSAYQQYLQGRYFWNKRTEAGLRKAIVYFQQALREDPHYALAHAGLADTYVVMADSVMLPPGEAWLKVEQEARAALEIDPTIAEAHTALANMTYIYRWNWPAAEEEFRRAIELKPSYATAHQWYFAFLTFSGRPEEALIQIDKAQELDPLSLIISANVGLRHYFARRYEQALAQFRKTLEMDPGFAPAKLQMAKTYACLGQYQRAIEESSKLVAAGPEKLTYKALLGQVYAAAGDRARAESILKELGALSKPRFVSAYLIAAIYAGLGQKGAALDSLEKARREHDAILPYLTVDPYFDSLRQEPRFVELLREIGPRR
jgi:serine/threonine-protein kinase